MPLPAGLEGAKGVLEKLPGIGNLSVVMRIFAPGAAAAAVLYPFVGWAVPKYDLTSTLSVALHTAAWLVALGALGILVSVILGDKVYEIYEGRSLWPARALRWATELQARRVTRLRDAAAGTNDPRVYDEAWAKLRAYPFRAGPEPYAYRPTLLGNILYAYEDYPRQRYGMDAVFYWPRLWLVIEKDRKEEIDTGWSIADGLLALSAVSFAGGPLWIAAAVTQCVTRALGALGPPVPVPFGAPWAGGLGGLALVAIGYAWYRMSLPFHEKNGDVFKAIFDLYRDKIAAMTRVGASASAVWEGTWAYLQWLQVHCVRCETYYAADQALCPTCQLAREQSLEVLRRAADRTTEKK